MYLLNRLPAAIFVRRCSVCLPCLLSVIPVSISCFPYCPSPSFCITPSCRSLALQGKPGDVAMGGVYVLVHPPQPCHAPPSTSRICRRSYIKMAIILPMTATKMIYPKMILCCNGIRFFSIRITSYPLKKQILTTADLASSTCNKTQQYLSILLLPTERRAYNTSSFLYPDTVLTAFGNSRQYTGFSESKDGTDSVTPFLIDKVAAHVIRGVHVPVPCAELI